MGSPEAGSAYATLGNALGELAGYHWWNATEGWSDKMVAKVIAGKALGDDHGAL